MGSQFECFLLCKKTVPNVHPKPSLAQLEIISPCPISCLLRKETDTFLVATFFQVVVESLHFSSLNNPIFLTSAIPCRSCFVVPSPNVLAKEGLWCKATGLGLATAHTCPIGWRQHHRSSLLAFRQYYMGAFLFCKVKLFPQTAILFSWWALVIKIVLCSLLIYCDIVLWYLRMSFFTSKHVHLWLLTFMASKMHRKGMPTVSHHLAFLWISWRY